MFQLGLESFILILKFIALSSQLRALLVYFKPMFPTLILVHNKLKKF